MSRGVDSWVVKLTYESWNRRVVESTCEVVESAHESWSRIMSLVGVDLWVVESKSCGVDLWIRGVDSRVVKSTYESWNRKILESTCGVGSWVVESNHEWWNRFVTKIIWNLFILYFFEKWTFSKSTPRLHESTTPQNRLHDSTTPRSKMSQPATPRYFAIGNNSYRPFNNSKLKVYLNPQRRVWKWLVEIIVDFMLFIFNSLAVTFVVGSILERYWRKLPNVTKLAKKDSYF